MNESKSNMISEIKLRSQNSSNDVTQNKFESIIENGN